jgi:hypothetical protein
VQPEIKVVCVASTIFLMSRRFRSNLQGRNSGDDMTCKTFSFVYPRTGFRSGDKHAVKIQLPDVVPAGGAIDRAPTLLAIGLADLLSGFACQTVRADDHEFNQATQLRAAEAELRNIRPPPESRR